MTIALLAIKYNALFVNLVTIQIITMTAKYAKMGFLIVKYVNLASNVLFAKLGLYLLQMVPHANFANRKLMDASSVLRIQYAIIVCMGTTLIMELAKSAMKAAKDATLLTVIHV